MRRTWLGLWCGGAVLSVMAAAGGDGEQVDTPAGYLAVVSQATADAGRARMALGGASDADSSTFEGVIDLRTGDLEMRGELAFPVRPGPTEDADLDGDVEIVTLGTP